MAHAQAAIQPLPCDGCGEPASSEHIALRLRRLELTTRYRPIHIQAVFLGAQSPARGEEFLYGTPGEFQGEAGQLLHALNIETSGRLADAVLVDFQRKGFLLTHVLECAGEQGTAVDALNALKRKLPGALKRLRTSLRSKKVVVFSAAMAPLIEDLKSAQIGSELLLDGDRPFVMSDPASVTRLRSVL